MGYDVVVFGAHPDDAEMGMGGTIARIVRDGRSLLIVSLTHGECGTFGDPELRAREAEAAAKVLGCDHRLLEFKDTRIRHDHESRMEIMRLLRELRPTLVFAPSYRNTMGHHDGAGHVDHVATGSLVREAVRLARLKGVERDMQAHDVRRLYYYMVPRNETPDIVVDVTEDFPTLVRAIEAYQSQMAIERQGRRILDILETYRRMYGLWAGSRYAEAFGVEEVLRPDTKQLFTL